MKNYLKLGLMYALLGTVTSTSLNACEFKTYQTQQQIDSQNKDLEQKVNSFLKKIRETPIQIKAVKDSFKFNISNQEQRKIKICINPGHGPDDGVKYRNLGGQNERYNLKEHHLALVVGKELETILKNDPRFEVYVTKTSNDYAPEIKEYIQAQEIRTEIKNKRSEPRDKKVKRMFAKNLIKKRKEDKKPTEEQKKVRREEGINAYAERLFAEKNKYDLILNIHFDDNDSLYTKNKKTKKRERIKGFSLIMNPFYESDSIYSLTHKIIDEISSEMQKYYPISNFQLTNDFSEFLKAGEIRDFNKDSIQMVGKNYRNLWITGDDIYGAKIPNITVELEFIKNINVNKNQAEKYLSQKNFSQKIYFGLLNAYGLKPLPTNEHKSDSTFVNLTSKPDSTNKQ